MQNKKPQTAHDALILTGVILMLCVVTRLWPLILLILVALIAAAILLLYQSLQRQRMAERMPALPPASAIPSPAGMLETAFAMLERAITREVLRDYPQARWIWETPHPIRRMEDNGPLFILLNRAGGYRRAEVLLENRQLLRLQYDGMGECSTAQPEPVIHLCGVPEPEEERIDYSLAAMEWVEEHICYINERCNEAIAREENTFLIPSDKLPEPAAWEDIRQTLLRHEFSDVEIMEEGILITSPV